MDILKCPMPQRLHDDVLRGLSLKDHIKYLYFFYKYKEMLKSSSNMGADQQLKLRYSIDWFNQINLIASGCARWAALRYISDTFPAGEWEGLSTVKAFEYLYHKTMGADTPEVFKKSYVYVGGKEFRCLFCGVNCPSDEAVIRKGIPACGGCGGGCGGGLHSPVKVFLYAETGSPYLSRFRSVCGRVVEEVGSLKEAGMVHIFSDEPESLGKGFDVFKGAMELGLPVVILESLPDEKESASAFGSSAGEHEGSLELVGDGGIPIGHTEN